MGSLTKADKALLRRALCDAMDDRASYADAWPNGAEERADALELVRRYEALHVKMFGEASSRQQQREELDKIPMVSIHEITLRSRGASHAE